MKDAKPNIRLGLNNPLLFLVILFAVWLFIYQFCKTNFSCQLIISRFFLLGLTCWGGGYLVKHKEQFLLNETSPYTLSVFRIVFYGFVSIGFVAPLYLFDIKTLSFPWAEIPIAQRISPPFMNWYVSNVPVNNQSVIVSVKLIAVSAFCCMVGFKHRFFSVVFLLTTFYINGFPNFFGKINHNHYIIWFAAILCFSPCADAFSIDSVVRNLKNQKGIRRPQDYGISVYLISILVGIIYFFPGFHKVWTSGLQWAFSDNLKNQLFVKALEFGHNSPLYYTPFFDLLLQWTAMFTIFFELSFIFLITTPLYKTVAIITGFVFHLAVFFLMQINFVYLLLCYVIFINWDVFFKRLQLTSSSAILVTSSYSRSLVLVGLILVFLNTTAGFFKINSWPISCFPTFENIVGNTAAVLEYKINQKENIDKSRLRKTYGESTLRQWENDLIASHNNQAAHALQERIRMKSSKTKPGDTIDIYLQHLRISNNRWIQTGKDSLLYSFY